QEDGIARGKLMEIRKSRETGHIEEVIVQTPGGEERNFQAKKLKEAARVIVPDVNKQEDLFDAFLNFWAQLEQLDQVIEFGDQSFEILGGLQKGDDVIVSRYVLRDIVHYRLRLA